jgi:hypothetical protein
MEECVGPSPFKKDPLQCVVGRYRSLANNRLSAAFVCLREVAAICCPRPRIQPIKSQLKQALIIPLSFGDSQNPLVYS